MKRLKEFINNINHFNNNNNAPDPHKVYNHMKKFIKENEIKNKLITYKVFQYKGDTYLIYWTEERYTNIHLLKEINKDFEEVYNIYDSTIKDKIGNCEDYYIKATEFVMELYEDKVKKETFKENQKKMFEEWDGVIE